MTTLEDIFNPIERNAWIYADDDEDFIVYPIQICNDPYYRISKTKNEYIKVKNSYKIIQVPKSTEENLKIKHYIKFGEECPICYEPIFLKNTAYLSDCGHSFHRECIHKWTMTTFLNGRCPVCRQDFGDYDCQRYLKKKGLDSLEEFWINSNTIRPHLCRFNDNYTHISGTNKYCIECMEFRKCKKQNKKK